MPVPLTLAAFAARVAPELHSLAYESMNDFFAPGNRNFGWVPQVFRVAPTDRLVHEFSNQEGIGEWPIGSELSPYPVHEWELPADSQFMLQMYKDSFLISDVLLKYGGDPLLHVYPKLAERTRDFILGAMKAYDLRAAQILLDAFTGGVLTCPDGLPLFSNTHVKGNDPTIYDNLITWQLSAAALDAAYRLNVNEDLTDASGHPLNPTYDTIVIGKRNRRIAYELISNTVKPAASNDERNYWNGVLDTVIECPWFAPRYGSADYWMLMDSRQHTLSGLVAEPPSVTLSTGVGGPDQLQFYGRTIFEFFFKDFVGVIGSNGSQVLTI